MWPASLRLLHVTWSTAAENLAADEALLHAVEDDPAAACLRLWEPTSYAVIVGRSNALDREVNLQACAADGVPVLRRCSGGGAVVIGPGCLCYALVLPIDERHRSQGISVTTAAVLTRMRDEFAAGGLPVEVCGVSDLVLEGRKFSGNSQRWLRRALLHHGTLLAQFDLTRISRWLKSPSLQPEYRAGRTHDDFVRNAPLSTDELVAVLARAWNARLAEPSPADFARLPSLLAERYADPAWHRQR